MAKLRKTDLNVLKGMAKAEGTPEGVTLGAMRLGLLQAGVTQHNATTILGSLERLIERGLVVRNVVTRQSVEVRYQLTPVAAIATVNI
jgi:DNA-binding HxlR family transcriptional regulator